MLVGRSDGTIEVYSVDEAREPTQRFKHASEILCTGYRINAFDRGGTEVIPSSLQNLAIHLFSRRQIQFLLPLTDYL